MYSRTPVVVAGGHLGWRTSQLAVKFEAIQDVKVSVAWHEGVSNQKL